MATTSPDNLRTPDLGDQYALVQDLAALADLIQIALDRRANAFIGTSQERVAYTDTATNGQLWKDTNGSKALWFKDGATWATVIPPAPAQARIRAGFVNFNNVTPSESQTQKVTFPANTFTQPPIVVLGSNTGASTGTIVHFWVSGNATAADFTIGMVKGSNVAQRINWIAVQNA